MIVADVMIGSPYPMLDAMLYYIFGKYASVTKDGMMNSKDNKEKEIPHYNTVTSKEARIYKEEAPWFH